MEQGRGVFQLLSPERQMRHRGTPEILLRVIQDREEGDQMPVLRVVVGTITLVLL